jgi:hypothetical protein
MGVLPMNSFTIALIIFLAIGLIAIGPFMLIWSLNSLFGLGIAYTIKTWFASLILSSFVAASGTSKSSSK